MVLYEKIGTVSSPGGVAVDNFHVYWGNRVLGTKVGSVVKGFEVTAANADTETVQAIASNVDKVFGVCLAENNIFFSVPKSHLYAVDKSGTNTSKVNIVGVST